jgi:hypothetical protein
MAEYTPPKSNNVIWTPPSGDILVDEPSAKPKEETAPAAKPTSSFSRFMSGLADPYYEVEKLGLQAEQAVKGALGFSGEAPSTKKRREEIEAREKELSAEEKASGVTGVDYPRMAGNVLTSLATPAGRLGSTVAGAIQGALTNTQGEDNYWAQKLKNIAVGGATGATLGAAGKAISTAAAPVLGAAQQQLAKAGVEMTPGQMLGGAARRAEEVAKHFPILGNFIRKAENRGIEDFNTSTINQVLEPIGAALPQGTKPGHEAIKYAQQAADKAYSDAIPPSAVLNITPSLANQLHTIDTLASEIPPPQYAQFQNIVNNRLKAHFGQGAQITGETIANINNELGSAMRSNLSAKDDALRQLGGMIKQVRNVFRDEVKAQNPGIAGKLDNADATYAMLTRVERASARRADSEGIFTPKDLLQSVKTSDASFRKRNFAAGDALMQDWAEIGQSILGDKIEHSTALEGLSLIDAGKLAAAGAVNPKLLAAPVLGAGLYAKPVTGAINKYIQSSPGPVRQGISTLGETIRNASAPIAQSVEDELNQ